MLNLVANSKSTLEKLKGYLDLSDVKLEAEPLELCELKSLYASLKIDFEEEEIPIRSAIFFKEVESFKTQKVDFTVF